MDCKIVLALIALCASAALSSPTSDPKIDITPPRDPCVCTRNFAPVCGSDDKTYSNECVMNCFNSKEGKSVTVASQGRCKDEPCVCTFEYKPVCANDGKTYPNRCSMLCQRSANPEVDVVSEGQCSDEVKVAEPPCICTDDLDEVCGSNGNSYSNPCLLNCATAKEPSLSIAHSGKCDNKVKIAVPNIPSSVQVAEPEGSSNVQSDQPRTDCVCPRNLRPVCGSDGKTYNNNCLLQCAGTTVARSGNCQ